MLHRGQNPLHVLGQYGKENSGAVFELFMECIPDYPIDQLDANGNSGIHVPFAMSLLVLFIFDF